MRTTCLGSVIESLALEGYADEEIVEHFRDKLMISVSQKFVRDERAYLKLDSQPKEMKMTNVYEGGQGDARQTDAAAIPDDCKLFRKRYRQLSTEEVALHDAIKDKADELAALVGKVTDMIGARPKGAAPVHGVGTGHALLSSVANNQGANVTLALRHLEDCVYRAVKALTA